MRPSLIALKMFLLMTLLTGIIYPLIVTAIAQLTMPKQAQGSLLFKGNQLIGSTLIAQQFKNDNYFWARPSAIDYDPIRPSGGSNLGPTSQKLKSEIDKRVRRITNHSKPLHAAIPAELVYASGSGLDPHLSPEAAYFQIERISRERGILPPDYPKIKALIDSFIQGNEFGFIGPLHVNVLQLNRALDEQFLMKHP